MSVEKQWQDGIDRVNRALSLLDQGELERLRALCRQMMARKAAMQELVAQVDASAHCAHCQGACCVKGKYHLTGVDLLAYLVTDQPLFVPLFANGLCPYLAKTGCLMRPAYRPFNCITFNCETIEDLLPPEAVARFYALERETRESYREIRAIFPGNSMEGALLQAAAD